MKKKKQIINGAFLILIMLFTSGFLSVRGEATDISMDPIKETMVDVIQQTESISGNSITQPSDTTVQPKYSANAITDRITGTYKYTVQGVSSGQIVTLQVMRAVSESMITALEREIVLTEGNCINNIYQGEFTLDDVDNIYADYLVFFVIDGEKISAESCDFSIHTDGIQMNIKGNNSEAVRTVKLNFQDSMESVVVPGKGSQIAVMAWQKGKREETAQILVENLPVSGGSITYPVDVANISMAYGTFCAKAVIINDHWEEALTIAETEYEVAFTYKSFTAKKSKALEKKNSFAINLKGLKNVYEIERVTFEIYNGKGKKVTNIAAQKKGSNYYAEVSLKKLDYQLERYTIKAVLTDSNGEVKIVDTEASIDERIQKGTLSVIKKGNAKCSYQLSKAYIPGNIKKVEFALYQVQNGKEKELDIYLAKASGNKKKFSVSVKQEQVGDYKVKAYGLTAWNEKILLNQQTYQLKDKDMGKNGWYYEKYDGKSYKFYYINNVKQTDLTKILNLQESNESHSNNLYIELNRAACTVTIYLYNEETGKYDIPIKNCAVSVGRDTYTTAGSSGLNINSSYTPLGDYSICSNGTSVKYTLKPMYEPNGSIVYARWCSHIVGNVYFHAIAVGSQSHYALSSYTYNRLGSPASAGCVRMTVADAKWIYDYAPKGTKVKIIKGDSSKAGPLGKSKTIKTQSGISYDPTDPEVPDSRKKSDYKAGRISGYMTKDGEKVGY